MEISDNEILFTRLTDSAILPSKRDEDGGYDIYANFTVPCMTISPHSIKLIPTGLASAFSPKYRIRLHERGSNTKSHLSISAGIIDSGYRGQWFVAVRNTSDKIVKIDKSSVEVEELGNVIYWPYTKAIAQACIEIVPQVSIKEIPYDDLIGIKSDRGSGALGSSGK